MASNVQMIRHAPSGSMDAEERDKLMKLCEELAADFATRAAEYDRESKFPVENFAKIKEANLLAIMIPKEYGGWGADFLTYTKALERLAQGDAATALAYNMHNIMVGSIAEVPEAVGDDRHASAANEFRAWVYGECVKNKKVFASATSEPGIGAAFTFDGCSTCG